MAIIPIIGRVTVDGASKEISGGYVNIGGVWKPITKTYVNVNGVWKNAWKSVYKWAKYAVTTSNIYEAYENDISHNVTKSGTAYINTGKSYSVDQTNGTITLVDTKKWQVQYYYTGSNRAEYPYIIASGTSNFARTVNVAKSSSNYTIYYRKILTRMVETQGKGDLIDYVTAENEDAYPEDGVHTDGYWYVKQ